MRVKTSGGAAGTGAGGGREVVGAGVGMGGGKQKSTFSPHIQKDIVLACTLISAPAVVRNSLLKIIGMWGLSSMSITKKWHGMTNSATLTGIFQDADRLPDGAIC